MLLRTLSLPYTLQGLTVIQDSSRVARLERLGGGAGLESHQCGQATVVGDNGHPLRLALDGLGHIGHRAIARVPAFDVSGSIRRNEVARIEVSGPGALHQAGPTYLLVHTAAGATSPLGSSLSVQKILHPGMDLAIAD